MGPRALLLGTVALAGCYKPSFGDCELACGANDTCPSELSCVAGRCSATGQACPDRPPADGLTDAHLSCGDGLPVAGELCFFAPTLLAGPNAGVRDAQLVDVTRDGMLDIAWLAPQLSWATQLNGMFQSPRTLAASGAVLHAADLDADGTTELLDLGTVNVETFRTLPDGPLLAQSKSNSVPSSVVGIVTGDLVQPAGPLPVSAVYAYADRLLFATFDTSFAINLFSSSITFPEVRSIAAGKVAASDAHDTIFVGTGTDVTQISVGPGRTWPLQTATGATNVVAVALGDVDADGQLDLVVAQRLPSGGKITVFRRQSMLWAETASVSIPFVGDALLVTDVDHDGRADVLCSRELGVQSSLVIYRFLSTELEEGLEIPIGQKIDSISSGDFTGDGAVDILLTSRSAGMVTIIRSDS